MAEIVVRSLIRVIATVAIFAAVYFFIVKPVLDTTSETINTAFEGSQGITEQIQESLEKSGVEDFELNLDSQKEANRLLGCIQRADQDVDKIQHCNDRFG